MGDSVKSLAEVEVDYTHCSPLIYPASHAIIESYQLGQALILLGESLLTTPDSSTCLEMTSGMNCTITFPGMEVRLTGL